MAEHNVNEEKTVGFEEALARAFGYGALPGERNFSGFVKALEREDARIYVDFEDTTFAGACGFGPKDGVSFVAQLRAGLEGKANG